MGTRQGTEPRLRGGGQVPPPGLQGGPRGPWPLPAPETGQAALAWRLRVVLGRLHPACTGHVEPGYPRAPSTPQQGWGSWNPHRPRCGVPQGAGMWVSGSCASCLPQGLLRVGAAFQLGGSGDLFPRIQAKRPGQLVGVLPAGDPAP